MNKNKPQPNKSISNSSPKYFAGKINSLIQKRSFTDRLAVGLIIVVLVIGSLTPVYKAFTYIPYFGSYFNEAGNVLPRIRFDHMIISEVDCIGYYSYVRSVFIDHDINFQNDFELFGWPRRAKEKTSMGLTANPWSVGPAILWTPAFLLAHGISLGLNAINIPVPTNGVSFIYDFFIIFSSMLYGAIGILFIYFFLRSFFDPLRSFLSLLIYFYASPLVFYQFNEPTMSHILTVFAVSGFIYYWHRGWQQRSLKQWFYLGIWGGLIFLIRQQDIFFVIVPILAEIIYKFVNDKELLLAGPLTTFITTFICFIPQMVAWKILYGSFLTIPQGEGFMRWGAPQIFPLLFSLNHGLITYTPIILFCLIGLFFYKPENRMDIILLAVFLTIFLIELYINGAASDWSAGWAFGARRLLSCSIIFAWGLANLINWLWNKTAWRNIALGFFTFLILFNLLFYFQWYTGVISRGDPVTWQQYLPGKIDALFDWFKMMGYLFSLIWS